MRSRRTALAVARVTGLGIAIALAGCRQSSPPGVALALRTSSVPVPVLLPEHAAPPPDAPAPIGLRAGDGAELAWVALAADITLAGPLAHTELHLTLHNTEARTREGRFSIALPPNAAVSRFAMKVGDAWREARIVSRAQGREVYEHVLHRGADPALLEQDAGNAFSARVFPIAAGADKEIIIAYDDRVAESEPYRLPLHGLPEIPHLTVAIDQNGTRGTLDESGSRPDDVVLEVARHDDAVASGDVFVARIEAPSEGLAPAALDHVLLLVDTSASRAQLMARQGELVRAVIAALPGDAEVAVATYDQSVSELARGHARELGHVTDALAAHEALGASDLGSALAYAAAAGMARVVVIGDGTPTLGVWEPEQLAALVARSRIARIDAVQVGQSVDRDVLQPVVAAGRAPGAILDGHDSSRVVRQLATALAPERAIHVRGALASWPATTRGVAPGDPIFVSGRRRDPASAVGADASAPLAIRIGTRDVTVTPRPSDPAFAHRAVARAEVAALGEELQRAPAREREPLRAKIEQIALENHIVSSETSLLVLESDAMEHQMLGAPAQVQSELDARTQAHAHGGDAEREREPALDPTSTTQGITIDQNYIRNIPVAGRTFEEVLSGSTSLENQYIVDGPGGASGAHNDALDAQRADDHELLEANVDPTFVVQRLQRAQLARERNRQAEERERAAEPPPPPPSPPPAPPAPPAPPPPPPAPPSPYVGTLLDVMTALARDDRETAATVATRAHRAAPDDIAALLALGEALEARGDAVRAARAYGSIVDLYPGRAELARAAGERLDRVPGARLLAIDAYRRALRLRPDQVSTYRLLAYDLMREQRVEALDVVLAGVDRAQRASIRQILLEDDGVIAAYLLAHVPGERAAIEQRQRTVAPARPTLRVVLSWETDANDVDLHVFDKYANHAFYGAKDLASGGTLRDDITTGYGPEMFEVDHPRAFPYRIAADYFSRGPMGFGLGSVQIVHADGAGEVTVEDRPFVIQKDHTTIELGVITDD